MEEILLIKQMLPNTVTSHTCKSFGHNNIKAVNVISNCETNIWKNAKEIDVKFRIKTRYGGVFNFNKN